jgi:DNA-binding NarL/FixJ family response regulator
MNAIKIKKILLVEDESILRDSIQETIASCGFEVAVAENGDEALLLAKTFLPDLIISDILMPESDGYWLLDSVRNDALLRTIPFIFMTAKSERSDIRNGMNLGADDYIVKPFSSAELMNSIQARLSRDEILKSQLVEPQLNSNGEILDEKEQELILAAIKRLTKSEARILDSIAQNKSTLEIAEELFISYKTVENHRANITIKLGIKGHLSLVRFCLNYKNLIQQK